MRPARMYKPSLRFKSQYGDILTPRTATHPQSGAPRHAPNDAAKLAVQVTLSHTHRPSLSQLVQRADASQLLCTPYTPPSAPTPMAVSEPNQPIAPAAVHAERTNFEPARTSLPVTINSSGVSVMSTSPVAASRSASSPVGPSLLDRKPGASYPACCALSAAPHAPRRSPCSYRRR